jgi:predicted transcriptional regulator
MGGTESHLPSEIFMEIASDTRCEILKMLYEKPSHATKIASSLNLTKQETYRNTSRLTQVGLIKKDVEGLFSLTEYGKAIINQFSFFLFLEKHKKFFEDHDLDNIPQKFVTRLGELQNAELITGVALVLERFKKIQSGAKDHVKGMLGQAWEEHFQATLKLIKNNVAFKGLRSKQSVIPDEVLQTVGKQIIKEISKKNNFESRQVDRFGVLVYVTEGPCAIMFLNKHDQADLNSMFVGDDENVREWCNDVFDYYWSRSKPFDVRTSLKSS